MKFIEKITANISNNSIKENNLLNSYLVIIIFMSIILTIFVFYSAYMRYSYNRIISDFNNYNGIYSQIDSIDKNIYLNITEQMPYEQEEYKNIIKQINNKLTQIGSNSGAILICSDKLK